VLDATPCIWGWMRPNIYERGDCYGASKRQRRDSGPTVASTASNVSSSVKDRALSARIKAQMIQEAADKTAFALLNTARKMKPADLLRVKEVIVRRLQVLDKDDNDEKSLHVNVQKALTLLPAAIRVEMDDVITNALNEHKRVETTLNKELAKCQGAKPEKSVLKSLDEMAAALVTEHAVKEQGLQELHDALMFKKTLVAKGDRKNRDELRYKVGKVSRIRSA
jgi:hypothetical protein